MLKGSLQFIIIIIYILKIILFFLSLHLYWKDKKCGETSDATYFIYLNDDSGTNAMAPNSGLL